MSVMIELLAPSGLTLTVELFPYSSDVIANGAGGDALAEATNRKGLYTATVAETLSGWHTAHVKLSGTVISVGDVYLVDGATCRVRDHDARVSAEIAALEVVPLATVGAVHKPGDITIHRGDTFTLTLTGLDAAARTKAWFTLKEFDSDIDDDALIQITESGGLIRLDGEAAAESSHGSIVFAGDGASATVTIHGEATAVLEATATKGLRRGRVYDFQVLFAAGPATKTAGVAYVTADVTRAVS
jgi:hypothetical protein